MRDIFRYSIVTKLIFISGSTIKKLARHPLFLFVLLKNEGDYRQPTAGPSTVSLAREGWSSGYGTGMRIPETIDSWGKQSRACCSSNTRATLVFTLYFCWLRPYPYILINIVVGELTVIFVSWFLTKKVAKQCKKFFFDNFRLNVKFT